MYEYGMLAGMSSVEAGGGGVQGFRRRKEWSDGR